MCVCMCVFVCVCVCVCVRERERERGREREQKQIKRNYCFLLIHIDCTLCYVKWPQRVKEYKHIPFNVIMVFCISLHRIGLQYPPRKMFSVPSAHFYSLSLRPLVLTTARSVNSLLAHITVIFIAGSLVQHRFEQHYPYNHAYACKYFCCLSRILIRTSSTKWSGDKYLRNHTITHTHRYIYIYVYIIFLAYFQSISW